ncbi:MAG: 30S ribosomal protein S5 [Verrucomicrobiae bacterium]|nr:30S ribosomal protein S5 [Verrucomicrobiae bacterium]MCP5541560.1 30S ribosomal protein S5 [Akkermansiaceae bacterium]
MSEETNNDTPAEELETPEANEAAAETPAAEAPAVETPEAEADAPADAEGDSSGGAAESSGEERFDKLAAAERRLGEFRSGEEGPEYHEKVVHINRCAKVVKGGRRFSFSALVVCGDKQGRVGYGFGKANEVSECIRKASDASRKDMVEISLRDTTIPHEVIGEYGGGRVLLRPASPGTGIIAGGGVRAVVEAAGIKDVLAKSMGSKNQFNVVKATLAALETLRTRDEIFQLRGKKTRDQKAI